MINSFITYVNESVQELHQVRWPTRQQAVRLSLIVIAFVAITTMAFGGIDYLLGKIVQLLISFA